MGTDRGGGLGAVRIATLALAPVGLSSLGPAGGAFPAFPTLSAILLPAVFLTLLFIVVGIGHDDTPYVSVIGSRKRPPASLPSAH